MGGNCELDGSKAHEKHVVRRRFVTPAENLVYAQGKSRKFLIDLAGRKTF